MTDAPATLDRDDWVVAVGGAVTVVASFLPWYESPAGTVGLTAWGLGATAVFAVLLSAYAAVRVVYLRGRAPKPDVPVTPQAETFVAAGLALLLTVYRVLDAPSIDARPAVRTYGIIVAGLAVLAQFVCAARKIGRTGVRAQ